MRQRDRFDRCSRQLRARRFPFRWRRGLRGRGLRRSTPPERRCADPFDGLVAFGGVVLDGSGGAGGVLGVVAGDDAEQRGGVAHVGGEGADAVERRSKGDESVARDAAVGGQHADHSAKAGGLADGAAGVGAQRGHGEVGSHGCSGAAAGSAGNAIGVDGIAHGAVSGVFVRRAHGELVAVELAQEHCARGFELRDGGAVIRRLIALENFEPAVDGAPWTTITSLMPMGMPARAGRGSPFAADRRPARLVRGRVLWSGSGRR